MSKKRKTTLRAWKDPLFRAKAVKKGRTVPAHPAGTPTDFSELDQAVGGITFTGGCTSLGCSVSPCDDTSVCGTLGSACGTSGGTCWTQQPYVCSTCCNSGPECGAE